MILKIAPIASDRYAPSGPIFNVNTRIYIDISMNKNSLHVVSMSDITPFPIPWNMNEQHNPIGKASKNKHNILSASVIIELNPALDDV